MTQPAQAPQSPKSLPPAVVWTALSLCLVLLIAWAIYYARHPNPTPAPAQAKPAGTTPGVINPASTVALSSKAYPETLLRTLPPQGLAVFDGTTFLVKGAIRVSGLDMARANRNFPGAVVDIPVNRKGSRIHLLQAVEHSWSSRMPEGTPYARFVFHYADGKTHNFDLRWAVHGWDWGPKAEEPEQDLLDKNTRVGWTIPRPVGWPFPVRCLQLFHTTVENPFPEMDITSFDVITTFAVGNLILWGFTVDNDPRPLAPAVNQTEPSLQPITFTLQDATGNPVPRAKLSWIAVLKRGQIVFPAFTADALGQVTIEVPRGALAEIHYRASAPDGKQATGTLTPDENRAFSASQTIRLTSIATTIIPTAREAADATWRYTTQRPPANWLDPDFDDTTWQTGAAGFGTRAAPGSTVRTDWRTPDIFLRREFTLPEGGLKDPWLTLHHDDDAEIYINGNLVLTAPNYLINYETTPLPPTAKDAFKPGRNIIAIHCHQVGGEQYIDAGLTDLLPAK